MSVKELARKYKENALEVLKKYREGKGYRLSELRAALEIVMMSEEELINELKVLARDVSGCLSCKHSMPHPDYPVYLAVRACKLKKNQARCKSYERYEDY